MENFIIGIFINAIVSHQFWIELTPIIAHNHVENYVGWLIIIVLFLTIITIVSKIGTNAKLCP